MISNKVIIGLAALTVVTSGYAAAELAYQKEKRKGRTERLGDKQYLRVYKGRFMDIDGEPIMSFWDNIGSPENTFAAHAVNSIKKNLKKKLKYRNTPRENSDNNLLFGTFEGQDFGLSLDNRKCNRNAHVLTIGYGGSSDRFNYIRANIMQENSSAVIVDPNGDLYRNLAPALISKGYPVYLFDLTNPSASNHYNPLDYVYEKDGRINEVFVDSLVDLYMEIETQDRKSYHGDPFWNKTMRALLTALVYYVLGNDDIPKKDKCFNTILEKTILATSSKDYALFSEIDAWLKKASESEDEYLKWVAHKMKLYYDTFLVAPQKTHSAIAINLSSSLSLFSSEGINNLTRTEKKHSSLNIDLNKLCSQQAYLFVVPPRLHISAVYNNLLSFLSSVLFMQFYQTAYRGGEKTFRGKYHIGYREGLPVFDCFDSLDDAVNFKKQVSDKNIVEHEYDKSEAKVYDLTWTDFYGNTRSYKTCRDYEALQKYVNNLDKMVIWSGNEFSHGAPALPVHVNVFLNDFAKCSYIPNFLTILATSRKYRIGNHCMINSVEELKRMYEEGEHETLLANVDTIIYFGSDNQPASDIELIQKAIGKTTIFPFGRCRKDGASISVTVTEVFLMTLDEINAIGNLNNKGKRDNHELVLIRDCLPYICSKYNIKKHKRYNEYKAAASHTEEN